MRIIKYILPVIAWLLFKVPAFTQPKFEVKFSEPLAVFIFVQHLSANHAGDPFNAVFISSAYNKERYTRLITRFDSLTLMYAYEFPGFPIGSKLPGMTDRLLKKNLIDCTSLQDFKTRSLGVIPDADLLTLTTVLEAFIPVYRELVYNPNKDRFEQQLKNLSAELISKNIAAYYETGLQFYGTIGDDSIPFEIALYPLPRARGFTAEAFIHDAISAVPMTGTDDNGLLGVMLHEIFHTIYNEQPLVLKQRISGWFRDNPAACSNYAYWLMNEAFATVLGNGYAYAGLSGKIDTGAWYNQRYINAMAKTLYPLVKQYIAAGKTIDRDFVDRYVQLYQEHYVSWLRELDNLLTYRYVLTDDANDFEAIGRAYPYTSYAAGDMGITTAAVKKMSQTPITKLVIISRDHRKGLEIVKHAFPELVRWQLRPNREFTCHVFLKDKTQLIIINRFSTTTVKILQETFVKP